MKMKKFFKGMLIFAFGAGVGVIAANREVRTGIKNAAANTKDAVKSGINRITTRETADEVVK